MLISIVVPTYRRPDSLRALLRGLSVQSFEGAFEVVVVDDDGGGLQQVVEPFQTHLNLKLLSQPNSGPAQARNLGARHATGLRLVFLDDDCVPEAHCLQRIAEAHDEYPDAAIGGLTRNLLTDNIYSSASQLLLDFLYGHFQEEGPRADRFFTTNNLSVPRRRFLAIGGFDTGFSMAAGEDRELSDRWRFHAGELVFDPRIVVGHAHPLALRSFIRQHLRYGTAAKRYWRLKRLRERGRPRLKSKHFYSRLVCYPVIRFGLSLKAGALASLFALSQVANALGYLAAPEPDLDTRPRVEPSGPIGRAVRDGPSEGV